MKPRDLANLLNRAAAALETPPDITPVDKQALLEDLTVAAKEVETSEKQEDAGKARQAS